MSGNMASEAISNGFIQNTIIGGSNPPHPIIKKKRNLPGTPDPEAEVIALSPKTLMATNRFLCEICGKGFQRDQNLQLHRRGHNLPWKLKQRTSKEIRKRVYVCPEKTCVHNHPSRALGDLTGIKKHFCRKHGEKKWKCEKCQKRYAVHSDHKAHSKTCGTREYKCDCGTVFSRRDSFITHRAFCDALAEETARVTAASHTSNNITTTTAPASFNYPFTGSPTPLGPSMAQHFSSIFKPISTTHYDLIDPTKQGLSLWMNQANTNQEIPNQSLFNEVVPLTIPISNPPPSDYNFNWILGNKHQSCDEDEEQHLSSSTSSIIPSANMSATALLQKAAQMGATSSNIRVLDDTKYCGLYGISSLCTESSSVEDELCSLNHYQTYPSKRRHILNDQESGGSGGGGQTRDFLGVGVQPICHPPSINGWI